MFGVDHGCDASHFLRFGDSVESQCGLAGRFGAEDLNDSSTGKTTHSEGIIEADGTGGNHVDGFDVFVAEFHDGSAAIIFFYIVECLGKGVEFGLFGVNLFAGFFHGCFFFGFLFHVWWLLFVFRWIYVL